MNITSVFSYRVQTLRNPLIRLNKRSTTFRMKLGVPAAL